MQAISSYVFSFLGTFCRSATIRVSAVLPWNTPVCLHQHGCWKPPPNPKSKWWMETILQQNVLEHAATPPPPPPPHLGKRSHLKCSSHEGSVPLTTKIFPSSFRSKSFLHRSQVIAKSSATPCMTNVCLKGTDYALFPHILLFPDKLLLGRYNSDGLQCIIYHLLGVAPLATVTAIRLTSNSQDWLKRLPHLHVVHPDFRIIPFSLQLQLDVQHSNLGSGVRLGLHLKTCIAECFLERHTSHQSRVLHNSNSSLIPGQPPAESCTTAA